MRKINTIIAIIITVIMLFSVVAIYAKPTSTIQSISENESMEEETTEAEPGETTFDEIEETTYINRVEKEWIEDATTNLPWDIDIFTTSLKDTSLKETEETTKQYDVYKYRGYSYNILEDGTVRIVGFYPPTVPEGMVTLELSGIPSEIDGKRVTCIGRSAFVGTGIDLSEHGLVYIYIPESVTIIEPSAFACSKATISISASANIRRIGARAFRECSGLYTVTIPKDVEQIEEGVFYRCTKLRNVVMQNGITSIGNQAFAECDDLRNVTLPNTLTYIGEKAFANCKSLTSIKIPANTIVESNAFEGCDNLKIEYEKVESDIHNATTTAKISVGATKVKKVVKTQKSKKAKISLKKVSGARYEVKISTTKAFGKKNTITKKVDKVTFTIKSKKIAGKKNVFVKARAYRIVNGKIYYGAWSKVKKSSKQ